jgi:thiosulfate/3-mercaptopyruvate sulfurtransferase
VTPLISAGRLAELLLAGEDVTLLDVRWSLGGGPDRAAYAAGHVPGALFVDLDKDLAAPPGADGRHPLPAPERFAAAMRRAGVRRHVPVVVYDQRDGMAAARAWWLLRHHGHEPVHLLDGGYDAWVAAGGAVSDADVSAPPGDFVVGPGLLRAVDADTAAATARSGVLLDARAEERYRGEVEPVDAVAGHIPGAVSAPTTGNLDDSGRLRGAEELRNRFSALGVGDGVETVVYCGSGVTAAHQVLALTLAGFDAALYPGSWSEWITDPARPVATGPEPG